MVPCFEKHIRVTSIECLGSKLPVNAPDVFWALVNSSQRDPSGIAAVEYTIVLLNRILKPELQTEEVLKASSVLAKRMAELKPVSTLREQFPSNLFLFRGAAIGVRRLCDSLDVAEFSSRILDPTRMDRLIAQPAKAAMFDKFLKVYPDFDGMIVKPLQDIAKLDPVSITNLLGIALSLDLPNTLGNFSTFETRLRIIQPDFVVTEVINPLMRFGVTNPQRIIRRCPSLFAAAATRDGEQSRLLVALSTLNGLLTRKELASVHAILIVAVLTRGQEDLEKTYNYLTEVMGLEGSRSIMGSGSRSSRGAHENRHSTKLRLIASPAWRLSLRRTVARHSLLLFAGQWPPSIPQSVNKSRDQIVGQLLKCPPGEFSYWLEFHDSVSPSSESTRAPVFSAEDVRQFEKICENLVSDDDIGDFENEVGGDSDLDDEEYPEDQSDNEDHL
ncbi:unnamed protein product [Rodentolepis nana]|uniref:CBF domain-containing protein n=1 Tax=Rodentolepis nana TaxID=102285 RepID=A0A0R3T731_RODNA|nr:unnamed protein product [Rodentolepis nana]